MSDSNKPADLEYENMQAAIDNASSLFDNYEKKILDQKNLLRISGLVNSTLNMNEMNEALLFSCQGTILVSNISIFLIESIITNSFVLRSSVGLNEEPEKIRFKENDPLITRLSGKESCIFICDLKLENQYNASMEILKPVSPHMIIPMRFKEKLAGFMVFGEKLTRESFTTTEIDFLNNAANFAAIAAENIRLFEMATRDRMTNLFIHHYFQNRLEEEIARAIRYENSLSLLMFDIDHFKSVNDTYGHQAGDIVIKEIANLIRGSLRKLDLPARYGGEEFAIILPESTKRKAMQVAERIRKTIEKTEFDINKEEPIQVTISGGICELDQILPEYSDEEQQNTGSDIDFKKQLIHGADSALYKSKHSGRNQITIFSNTEE